MIISCLSLILSTGWAHEAGLPVTSAMVLWMILMLEAVTIWDIEKLYKTGWSYMASPP
jgi:hypothetical protein